MEIPKEFQIFGQKIKVEIREDLEFEDNCWGQATYRKNLIEIQSKAKSHDLPETQIEETFWHELTHWILFQISESKLRGDEDFVLKFSRALHQAIKTFKY